MTIQETAAQIMLIAPVPPPYGGMALQAELLQKFLRRDGLRVVLFPSNFAVYSRTSIWNRIPVARTMLRAIGIWGKLWTRMKSVEVVHVFAASWLYFFLVVYPAVVVARSRGKRVILNYRGGDAGRFFKRFGWMLAPLFRASDVVTAPSEFLAKLIREYFQVSVVIVPNILDLGVFRYRERATVEPKLLVTRHLEKIYDVESVVRGFQVVQSRFPAATLWIAGCGSQEEYLRKLVATLNLNNVRFLGHVDHDDLPAIYDQCDICVNASRVDNFPGALLEASAAGMPIVSSRAGGIPYIYEDRKNALLCEPGDWQAMAAAVEELVLSPSLTLHLSAEGTRLAQQFDWDSIQSSLYRAYGMAAKQAATHMASSV